MFFFIVAEFQNVSSGANAWARIMVPYLISGVNLTVTISFQASAPPSVK